MTCYSVQPSDGFLKGCRFLSFTKKMGRYKSKSFSGKYNQKPLDHAKQPAIDVLKTASKTAIQKTAEATCDLIGNVIAD